MKKVASVLLILSVLAGFLSLVIASDEENPAIRREKIQAEFDLEYKETTRELAPLNLNNYNKDFIARFIQRAFFEKPFVKAKADRAKITKEIIDSLLSGKAEDKPEEYRIEQFLRALTERVPESGFLSVSENEENYDKFQKESSISFDTDKAPGVIHVKFNVFKLELDSVDIFKRAMDGYLRTQGVMGEGMFPRKYIFDLRGCPGGDLAEAVRMAELFYKVQYNESPEQESEIRIKFIASSRLMYDKYLRPLDCLNELYCGETNIYFVNPWFLDKVEKERPEGFYIGGENHMLESTKEWTHRSFAMVKKEKLAEFKSFVDGFNSWLDSIPIVVLVDRETASAAELFVALLAHNHNVTIVGDRTYGKIIIGRIYPLVYDKSLVYNRKSGKKEPLNQLRVLREYYPRLLRGHGFKRPDPNLPPLMEDIVPIGIMRLSDSYWDNPELANDSRLKDICHKGIIPDVDVSGLDKDKQLERAVECLK